MPTRIRELTDPSGARARITLEPHRDGALLRFSRLDDGECGGDGEVLLDIYGTEILAGFIMSARLSVPSEMPDEAVGGPFASVFTLESGSDPRIVVEQARGTGRFVLPGSFWDRFYAELDLTIPHAKSIARNPPRTLH